MLFVLLCSYLQDFEIYGYARGGYGWNDTICSEKFGL